MISILTKLFIKDKENTSDPSVRRAYGILCGAVGIVLNLLIFALKYLAGVITGSIAVMADALNNLTDAGSSVITLVGFKLASKKNDKEHPFGHGRIEYISGLVVAVVIIYMGIELGKTSFQKILHPEPIVFDWLSAAILLCSIIVKLYMALYNRVVAKKIRSVAMEATAADSFSDAVSTAAVLAALLIGKFTGLMIDGWIGAAVSLMILYAGYKAAKETLAPLLGAAPDPELVGKIGQIIKSYPEISGIHDLIVHDYGPGRQMVSLHAEVPANGDILALHDLIDNVENRLKNELHCHAVIHMDPIVTDDARVLEVREEIMDVLHKKVFEQIAVHDFRMVEGPSHTNLVFDVVLPCTVVDSDTRICAEIQTAVRDIQENYRAVVTIDRDFTGEYFKNNTNIKKIRIFNIK